MLSPDATTDVVGACNSNSYLCNETSVLEDVTVKVSDISTSVVADSGAIVCNGSGASEERGANLSANLVSRDALSATDSVKDDVAMNAAHTVSPALNRLETTTMKLLSRDSTTDVISDRAVQSNVDSHTMPVTKARRVCCDAVENG